METKEEGKSQELACSHTAQGPEPGLGYDRAGCERRRLLLRGGCFGLLQREAIRTV